MVSSMEICRCCSNNSKNQTSLYEQISAFEGDATIDEKFTYADAIYLSTNVRYDEDDQLPHTICDACMDELVMSLNFRIKCAINERALHKEANIPYHEEGVSEGIYRDAMLGIYNIKLEDFNETGEKPQQNDLSQSTDIPNSDIKLEPISDKPNENDSKFYEEYKCDQCSEEFNSEIEFETHLEYYHDSTIQRCRCPTCNLLFASKECLALHMLNHANKKYSCPVCNKIFRKEQHMKNHLRTHRVDRSLECYECHRGFMRDSLLRHHVLLHSSEPPIHECIFCGHCSMNQSYMLNHMLWHDESIRCNQCDKTFGRHALFLMHQREHRSDLPHGCGKCPNRYSTRKALDNHSAKHKGKHCCVVCSSLLLES